MEFSARLVTTVESRERRGSKRHRLNLRALSYRANESTDVVIHDLSETGLRLESDVELASNQSIIVYLPEIGPTAAQVVWGKKPIYGCRFEKPISYWIVSAAILRSSAREQPNTSFFSDLPINMKPWLVSKDGDNPLPVLATIAALFVLLFIVGITGFMI